MRVKPKEKAREELHVHCDRPKQQPHSELDPTRVLASPGVMRWPRRRNQIAQLFDKSVRQLQEKYQQALISPDGTEGRQFLPGGRAEQLIEDPEVARIVEELAVSDAEYRAREGKSCWRRLWISLGLMKDDTAAEVFYRRVRGVDTDRRARIFAVLILSGVKLTSPAWRSFVRLIQATKTSEECLRDDLFGSLDLQHIEDLFGKDRTMNRDIFFNQKIVYPYVINGSQKTVSEEARMPYFQEMKIKVDEDTGFGIFKVKVDPANAHGFPADFIARKDIPHGHTNEEEVGRRLKKQKVMHTYIRKIHGVVRSKHKTHIFMELADCSLLEHMQLDEIPGTSLETKIASFEELMGPADALKFLHCDAIDPDTGAQEPIRHGDIKADNVVPITDQDGNVLYKLSDFGIACIGKEKKGPCVDQLTCCPPEFLANLIPGRDRSIRGDVWSFGCLCIIWLVWLLDGMGEDDGSKGLRHFQKRCWNKPTAASGDSPNQRFFIIEDNVERAENDFLGREGDSRDFETHMRTDDADHPVVMKLNPAVEAYVEHICGEDDDRGGREKTFIRKAFAALKDIALVPDPAKRGTMGHLCDALKQVIANARSDIPQTGPS